MLGTNRYKLFQFVNSSSGAAEKADSMLLQGPQFKSDECEKCKYKLLLVGDIEYFFLRHEQKMCMYVYKFKYVYIYICIYIYTYLFLYTYIHIFCS